MPRPSGCIIINQRPSRKMVPLARTFKNHWILSVLLYVFAFLFYAALMRVHAFTIYQARDLSRAIHLINGEWIWHGPDISGGGALPGPFYYWLLALPIAIFKTWESTVWLCIALGAGAATIIWNFGVRYFSSFTALLMFFCFLFSSTSWQNLIVFWNPSYIFIFQAALLLLLFEVTPRNKGRLFFAGFLLGLSLQIHYAQLIFLASSLGAIYLIPQASKKEKLKLLSCLLIGLFITLLPYLAWRIFSPASPSTYHSLFAGLTTFLNPIRYLFEFGLGEAPGYGQGEFWKFYSEFVGTNLLLFPTVVGWLITLFESIRTRKFPFRVSKYLLMTLILSIPTLFWPLWVGAMGRYTVVFFLVLSLLTAQMFGYILQRPGLKSWLLIVSTLGSFYFFRRMHFVSVPPWQTVVAIIISIFVVILGCRKLPTVQKIAVVAFFILALLLQRLYLGLPGETQKFPNYPTNIDRRRDVLRQIITMTGWNYETFRERTFVIGRHPEHDYSIIYEQLYDKTYPSLIKEYDGLILVHRSFSGFLERRAGQLEVNWALVRSSLPIEIWNASQNGWLKCVDLVVSSPFEFCLYKFNGPKVTWNNLGYPYRPKVEPPLFEVTSHQGVKKIDKNAAVLFLNRCANMEPDCTIFFEVTLQPNRNLLVRATGRPIAVPDPAPNPAWSVSMRELRLEVSCGAKKITYLFASHLGVPEGDLANVYAPSFLAPFENHFLLMCENPSKVSIVGEKGLTVLNNYTYKEMIPFRLDWERL